MLASEVVQGQPHLSGADAWRSGGRGGRDRRWPAGILARGIAQPAVARLDRAEARVAGGGGGGEGLAPAADQLRRDAAASPRPAQSNQRCVHELSISIKPAKSFASPPPDTPYRRARQEWDARMGSAVLSARAWRRIAFASLRWRASWASH